MRNLNRKSTLHGVLTSVVLLLASCGGGSGSAFTDSVQPNSFSPPADAQTLTAQLTTRFSTTSDYDVWRCNQADGSEPVFAIALPPSGSFGEGQVAVQFDQTDTGTKQFAFRWEAITSTELRISNLENTRNAVLSNYRFSDANTLSYQSENTNYNCLRVHGSAMFATDKPAPNSGQQTGPTPGDNTLSQAVPSPTGFTQLWAYSSYQFIGGITQLGDELVALFSDGSYTDDLSTVFNEGVAISQARNPEDWGAYQIRGGVLYLRESSEAAFDEALLDYNVYPGAVNGRLTGCYTSVVGAPLDVPVIAASLNTWCFDAAGRFTNDRTTYVSSSNTVGSGSEDSSGQYRIDGYAIRISYDNGAEVVMSFAYLDDVQSHISLNGQRFF